MKRSVYDPYPRTKANYVKKTAKQRKKNKNTIKNRMRALLLWSMGIALLFILTFTLYLFSTITSPKTVYIPKGSVFNTVAHLQKEGVNLYWIDAVTLRLIGHPQQGWIDIKEEKMNRIGYLRWLTTAKASTRKITLIPGETTEIFLQQLAKELFLDYSRLKNAFHEFAPLPEGNFVPDTYSIPNEITEEELIKHLLKQSEKIMIKWSDAEKISYKSDKWLQIVTKASVIQKEASSVTDMAYVSSVIDNRLKAGMRLQMDGTLNYGEYSHQKVTSHRIRTDRTPYNTYKNKGLPLFPVCNVSKDAIDAALNPKKTEYLYFVRGKNGEHVYSSYFSTHRKNIVNATK